jgi:hypothetical protein
VLFVATEVVVWFMALRVVVSISEGSFWSDVAEDLERALNAGALSDPQRAQALLSLVRDAAEVSAGPSFLVVLGAALGAFALERGIARLGMDGPVAAVALLLGSVLALNVFLRLALDGDWRIWDVGGVFTGQHVGDAREVDLNTLVAAGGLAATPGSALAITIGGFTLLWIRFLIAARAQVTFPRVLRSISVGLAVVLVTMIIGAIADVPNVAPYAVVHFVLGVVVLAVANNARAYIPAEGETRGVAPWLFAVSGTVGVLLAVAMVVALLAFLNAGVFFSLVGGVALRIIEVLLFIIITPLYWVMEKVFSLFSADGLFGIGQEGGPLDETEPETDDASGRVFPDWVGNLFRTLAVMVFIVMLYYLARLIVARRRPREGAVEETRSRGSGGASLRDVLRDILPSFRHTDPNAWMAQHPVYRLYGRALADADARGFHALNGETPIEFADRASRTLSAPFSDIGRAFDRARYGRHFPRLEEVREMEERVAHWELEVPATHELRESLQGAKQMSESDEIALRIEVRRASLQGDAERVRRLGEDETR